MWAAADYHPRPEATVSLLDVGQISVAPQTDDIFLRFKGACIIAAKDIIAEAADAPNHAARLDWANVISTGDDNAVSQRVRKILRYSIAVNSTFQAAGLAVTDQDIQFMVNSAVATPSLL